MLGGRGPYGNPQALVVGRERDGRASNGDGLVHAVRDRVDRHDRVVEFVRDPHGASGGDERVGAVADLDRGLRVSGGRLEAGHGAVELIGDPDRVERGDQRRRAVAHLLGQHDAPIRGVDPGNAVGRDRDPHAVGSEGDPGGQSGERHALDIFGDRVDAEEGDAARIGDP